MPAETMAIIDGHYYAYKFYFAMPKLTGPGGRPTGVTYAFANLFKDLREHLELTHWVLVFDAPSDNFRNEIYAEYKANRSPTPDDLKAQIPDVELLATATGIPVLKIDGFEADDVVATLAKTAAASGIEARILSKDKDIDQILSDRIKTWDPTKGLVRGPAELKEEKGFGPELVIDYLCMIGDSSDNVPGIDGVGPKTALKLLQQYGSLQGVLDHVGELKGKAQENVRNFLPQVELTRQLIRLRDVPDLPKLEKYRIDRAFTNDSQVYSSFGISNARFANGHASGAAMMKPASAPQDKSYKILTLAELPEYLGMLRRAGRCAIDTETTGLDPITAKLVGISFACGNGHDGKTDCRAAAYLPIAGLDHDTIPWEKARPVLKPFLEDPSVKKVAQNAKYDLRLFSTHGVEVQGFDGDAMIASWMLDPGRESHGLDHLTKSFFGEDKIPTSAVIDLKNGQTMAEVSVATVATYACEDAQCTWRLVELLEKKLAEHNLMKPYREQELPLVEVLARMENRGIRVDAEVLANTQRHLERYLEEVKRSIATVAGANFNPASPKQIAELLFEKLKLPVISRTKTGPSTDAGVLEALRHMHELPDLLLQHRMLSKLIGTYLVKLPSAISAVTGRIHTNFRQTVAETGRLASDQPNLQNIPKKTDLGREMRAAFVPAAGKIFLAADYSQIELRVLAHLSDDPTLKKAFHDGVDIHRFVAAAANHIDQDSVTPAQRNAAKAINFGIIYGQTAFGLSQQLGISRTEAQKFIDDYFARFSSVRAYIDGVIAEAAKRGYAQTTAGRRRYIPQLNSGNKNERLQGERIALNSTIQGSAADLIKQAMLRCEKLLPKGAQLILQIHDELLVEADEACADAAAKALHEAMTGAMKLSIPLVAEVRRGHSWLEVS